MEKGKGKAKGGPDTPTTLEDNTMAKVAGQTATIMSPQKAQESLNPTSKASRVWLGDGLGLISK